MDFILRPAAEHLLLNKNVSSAPGLDYAAFSEDTIYPSGTIGFVRRVKPVKLCGIAFGITCRLLLGAAFLERGYGQINRTCLGTIQSLTETERIVHNCQLAEMRGCVFAKAACNCACAT
jgi:hypothetical protein